MCRSFSSAYRVERIARPLLLLLPLPTATPRLTTHDCSALPTLPYPNLPVDAPLLFRPPAPTLPSPQTEKKKIIFDIPIPVVKVVSTYEQDITPTFKVPTSYVRAKKRTLAELNDTTFANNKVEFESSNGDLAWLSAHPRYGIKGDPRYRLSIAVFEKMVTLVEITCAVQDRIISVSEAEDIFIRELHLNPTNATDVTQDIYSHWIQRRNEVGGE